MVSTEQRGVKRRERNLFGAQFGEEFGEVCAWPEQAVAKWCWSYRYAASGACRRRDRARSIRWRRAFSASLGLLACYDTHFFRASRTASRNAVCNGSNAECDIFSTAGVAFCGVPGPNGGCGSYSRASVRNRA